MKTLLKKMLPLTLVCFISCHPNSSFIRTFENRSTKDILVTNLFTDGPVYLLAGQIKTETVGKNGSYNSFINTDFCPCDGTPKVTALDTSLHITKNINDCSNWEKKSEKKTGKGGRFACTFYLTNDDFKK